VSAPGRRSERDGAWPNPKMQTGPTAGQRSLKIAERQARWTIPILVVSMVAVVIIILVAVLVNI
jgi:hypothetical protein